MKYIFSLVVCAVTLSFVAQNKAIEFEKLTFDQALAKAKKEQKLIFMDAYTSWCGPCKWMSKHMFTNDKIAEYFNREFINVKFDMEKGEGVDIAKRYQVYCYPNLLFIDGDGKLVHRTAGAAQEVQDYLDMGETAKNPETRFGAWEAQYESKKNDVAFMQEYITLLAGTCLPMDEKLKYYFEMQDEKDLLKDYNWRTMFYYTRDFNSKEFKYLLAHQDEFASKYTADSVQMKVSYVFRDAGNRIFYRKDYQEEDYKALVKQIKDLNFAGHEAVLFHLELARINKMGSKEEMIAYAVAHGDKYYQLEDLNSISWTIYESSDDPKALQKAASWMAKLTSSEMGNNYACLDTYAAVLYKLKDKEKATKYAEMAIAKAKEEGLDKSRYKDTEKLLDKIKKL
ncbi:MAG: DUF255 domain-containing protein [Bacteroidetes bacterium]|nr:MAG: DUF255 domain-containing protein [Bacteroidota bacterium]